MEKFRGHEIKKLDNNWIYPHTGEAVRDKWESMGCGHCGKQDTPEGHDGCLGTLNPKKVKNACCGHGEESNAFVQYWNGRVVTGKEAIKLQSKL